METTIIQEVMAFLFGRKYYANLSYSKLGPEHSIASFIFTSKREAEIHKLSYANNDSFGYLTTISFRSRKVNPLMALKPIE